MTDNKKVSDIVTTWHRETFSRDNGTARAARARLKRCKSPTQALVVAETHDLNRRMRQHGKVPNADQLTLICVIFSHIDNVQGKKLAAQFGAISVNKVPKLNNMRFQSLIRASSHRDLFVPLRRSLDILGREVACDGCKLAEDLYYWNDMIRNEWCFQYFGASFAKVDKKE